MSESAAYRRAILEVLHANVERRRERGDDVSTYVAEPLIQSLMRTRGMPLRIEAIRGHLYYMKDRGYTKFKDVQGSGYLLWRITADGEDILDGTDKDQGIAEG
ncbi:MAG: hypothetical protein U1C74_16840 [Phenylobacterium sp.]|nr:hypothetical protein [Phenylobacterium sp.]